MAYDSHSLFSTGGNMIVQLWHTVVVYKATNLKHSQYPTDVTIRNFPVFNQICSAVELMS